MLQGKSASSHMPGGRLSPAACASRSDSTIYNKFHLNESAVDDLNKLVDRHEEELPLVSKSVAAATAIFSLFWKLGKDESREGLAKRTSAVLRSKKVGSLRLYDCLPATLALLLSQHSRPAISEPFVAISLEEA